MSTTSDRLEAVKQKLVATKRDRSKFLEPKDVVNWYIEFEQILEDVPAPLEKSSVGPQALDTLHVLSLALLTVGMTRVTPALYAQLHTLERLLRHLEIVAMYTPNEVGVVERRLKDLNDILSSPENLDLHVSDKVTNYIGDRIKTCNEYISHVKERLTSLTESEYPLFSQLIHLRRNITANIVDPDRDLQKDEELLKQISTYIEANDQNCSELVSYQLKACRLLTETFKNGPFVEEKYQKEYDELYELSKKLQVFLVTFRWTLRETDLYAYQEKMDKLDEPVYQLLQDVIQEKKGLEGAMPIVLLFYLTRKNLSMLYKLLDNAEPVTEALAPIHNQLLTTKRCLLDVKDMGGLSTLRELYPYQLKLDSIEKTRVDGKFVVNGHVPPGQGELNSLLAECFDLIYELQVELEERPDEDEDEDEGEDEE